MKKATTYYSFYKVILILGLTIVGFPAIIQSQSNPSDSLINEIAKAESDTSRFRLINKLARVTYIRNPDSAYQLLKEAIPQAEASGHQFSILELYYAKGLIYEYRAQYDSILYIYEKAKTIALELDHQLYHANILDLMGHAYHKKNQIELGIRYLRKALVIAEELGNQRAIMKETNNLGRMYAYAGNLDSADILMNRSLDILIKQGNKRMQAEIIANMGYNALKIGDFDKTMNYFQRSQNLMQEINDLQGTAILYTFIAEAYSIFGDYPKALENLNESLKLYNGTTHYADITMAHEQLSEIYITLEDYDNAQIHLEKTIEFWKKFNSNKISAELIFNRGRIKLLKKEYLEALEEFRLSRQTRKEDGQFLDPNLHLKLGLCFEKLYQLDSAFVNYEKSVANAKGIQYYKFEPQSFTGLGRIYEQKGEYTKAKEQFEAAFKAAQQAGIKDQEQEAAAGLYRMYKNLNNTTQALKYLEISSVLSDSLFNEKSTKTIANIQAESKFEQEKQQLAFQQEQENERQGNIRRFLMLALGVTALLLVIGFYYFRSKQKANAALSKLNGELVEQKGIVEEQKERLEELDEVKSRFFTNISHEFRTPLTIISGMAEQMKTKPEAWLDKGAEMIKQNTGQLLQLVNQILDLRKLESNSLTLDLTHGNIIPYLKYILESFQSLAEAKDLKVHFLPMTESVEMDYDPEKILRILSNLLSNAIKFTPAGGNIYIHTEQVQPNFLSIKVQDTGLGIPDEKVKHIFDRFYQVDDSSTRRGEGTGIGLTLSYELVKLLGGTITVQSAVNKGSTFIVNLPITQEAETQEALPETNISAEKINQLSLENTLAQSNTTLVQPTSASELNSEKPLLLIVEDNQDVAQYLIACLEETYQLEIAENGQIGVFKAIELIPDLIISDVMMPEKDGFELCDELKRDERTSHIPIILLTAKADFEARMSGLERGADDYLTKPFEPRELMIRLKNLFEIRKKLSQRYAQLVSVKETTEVIEEKAELAIEDAFILKIRDLIDENMMDTDYGQLQVCKALGLSRSQLFRKLKALTDKSPSIFIRSIRLQKAKELLLAGDLNVSEVAYEVGFTSPAYFSTSFAEEFGVPPVEIRKQH